MVPWLDRIKACLYFSTHEISIEVSNIVVFYYFSFWPSSQND
jgi:hypothetical protein